jgi:hypothetical protein
MKQKYTKQSTSVKYKKYLPEIKRLIDEGNLTNLIDVFKSYNISSHWIAFLKEKNILYKDKNNFYRWNEKVPVSSRLIQSFRDFNFEMNQKNALKKNTTTPDLFSKVKKEPVKRIRKQKIESEKIGLIRRFIKWIY